MGKKASWVAAVLFLTSIVVFSACSGGGGGAGAVGGGPVLDNNALLSSLAVSAGTLSPVFSSATATYASDVAVTTGAAGVTASTASAKATMTIDGTAIVSGATHTVNLAVGQTAIVIVVTAEDGVNTKTYSITATRPGVGLSPSTVNIASGSTGTMAAVLAAADSADTLVALDSSNSGAASVPLSATVPAGQTQTIFTISASGQPASAAITATLNGDHATATVNVLLPTCANQILDGTETDVDCGGSCTTKCGVGQACGVPGDCSSGICTGNVCAAALPLGAPCAGGADCQSGFCADGVCCNAACSGACSACSAASGASVDGTCGYKRSGTVCRPAAGICDVAETCTGASPDCPADAFQPSTFVCQVQSCSVWGFTPAANCNGVSASCPAPASISCDDNVACTVDTCDLINGCLHVPNDSLCDDGNLCNGAETCSPIGCLPGTPVSCGSGLSCDPGTGICQ